MVIPKSVFVGSECSSQNGFYAKYVEDVGGDMQRGNLLRLIDASQVRTPCLGRPYIREHVVVALPVEEVCRCVARMALADKSDEPVWISVWQRP